MTTVAAATENSIPNVPPRTSAFHLEAFIPTSHPLTRLRRISNHVSQLFTTSCQKLKYRKTDRPDKDITDHTSSAIQPNPFASVG